MAGVPCWHHRGSDITEILGDLIIKKVGDSDWDIMSPIEYRLNNGRVVQLERGTRIDFGSTGVFRGIAPSIGTAADWGYGLHDRLYLGHRDLHEQSFTRLQADEAMLEVFTHCGVNDVLAKSIHTAVRIGALSAWQTEEEKIAWAATDDHEFMDG